MLTDRSGYCLPELGRRGFGIATASRPIPGVEGQGCAQLRSHLRLRPMSGVELGKQGVRVADHDIDFSNTRVFDGLYMEIEPLAQRDYRQPSIDIGLKLFAQLASEVHRAS